MEKAKNVRRAAKGSITRSIGTVNTLIQANRPWEEVQSALDNVAKSFDNLVTKHEEYTLLLNDEEFEEAEQWMDDCTRELNQCNMFANDYIREAKLVIEENQAQAVNVIANVDQDPNIMNVNDVINGHTDNANVHVDDGDRKSVV